jgi:aminoglycoside phosphotransferase (APT) family kinase protein
VIVADAETIPVREGEELDAERIGAFLREALPDLPPDGEPTIRQFPTGASNLTYLIELGEWRGVLRRPPFGPVPPKAHDMEREARLLASLHPAFPLAPRLLALCSDRSVLGVPFHITEYREGAVIAFGLPEGVEPGEALGRAIGETVLRTLVELHEVDYRRAGLDGIGRPEGFMERQARGWIERYERAKTEEIPEVAPLTAWIARGVPRSPPATIIHNDYHLKNLLFDRSDPSRMVAVLDWEMATVGDPLMDLGVALSYWLEPGDPPALTAFLSTVTLGPGFPGRREFAERYATLSGRDLAEMGWYLPFAYFKLAVILQQIYARWARGQTRDPRFEGMGRTVREIVQHAAELVSPGGRF